MTVSSVPLAELVEDGSISYGIVQPGSDGEHGVPIVRVGDLESGSLKGAKPQMRVDPAVEAKFVRTRLRGGEVLVSLVGSVGRAAVVPPELSGWNVARAVGVLRPAAVEANWLVYALRSRTCQEQISAVLNTTVQATLNLADLKRLLVPMPERKVREAIAEVLGALDDKIAANAGLVDACDNLRRAKFESLLSGEALPLSSLARFVNGRAYTKGASGTGRVVIRIAELNSGIGGSTVYNDIDVPEDNRARPGDLLFAWSGSLVAARWYRPEGIVNQHIFKVIPEPGWPLWLVACALDKKLEDFRAIAADKATTMGHIQRHHLDELVSIPPTSEMASNDRAMTALWDRALAAEVESLKLADLRDTLLPHLMSGRITVREAEQQVEAVI
ncbi:MAG: restriction endonuclease subunit S [Propionicimonas sp.]|uniref:restriction endonuclease subunit S n=1 Tax=Propionicimonas sp. TaxID=1955623 RepID=UPI003D0E0F88